MVNSPIIITVLVDCVLEILSQLLIFPNRRYNGRTICVKRLIMSEFYIFTIEHCVF